MIVVVRTGIRMEAIAGMLDLVVGFTLNLPSRMTSPSLFGVVNETREVTNHH